MLIDTSSSMTEKCYGSVDIQKIHAVKELFSNFANRSMAYNFPHIVGLVKFDSSVETLQTFTETLETFKVNIRIHPQILTKMSETLVLTKTAREYCNLVHSSMSSNLTQKLCLL